MIIVHEVLNIKFPQCQVKQRGKIFVMKGNQDDSAHLNIDFDLYELIIFSSHLMRYDLLY